MSMAREYNNRLMRYAKEQGRYASFRKRSDYNMGYIIGTQRFVACIEVEPVSLDRLQIRRLLNWALSIYAHETPSDFEYGIINALTDIKGWLDDNPS